MNALLCLLALAGQDDVEFFEKKVRPVLVEHCYGCHSEGAKKLRGGLRLDTRDGARRGGDTGPAVVPGKPDESLLVKAVRSAEMPPKGRLPDHVTADLARWVEMGAPDPRDGAAAPEGPRGPSPEEGRAFWSFRPPADPVPPGPGHPIDAFLDAKRPGGAPEADRATLLRRVTFDLTGLPPTPGELAAFLADGDWEKVVDRLLASPRYGEKWGRRWLDLVRYADSNGVDEDVNHPHAWRYRDWVIRAFNDDLPYDRFIVAQLAGDLLPEPDLVAPGWLALGPKMLAEPDLEKMRMDIADEQIDVMSKTFLGLTASCARCHDHKFDPIEAVDYYALAGIFRSTTVIRDDSKRPALLVEIELPGPGNEAVRAEHRAAVAALRAEAAAEKDGKKAKALRDKAKALEADGPDIPRAHGVREIGAVDLAVHIRGNHLAPAPEKTPRGTPQVFEIAMERPAGSGRLELARWIARPDHPLTARVMVNRIWQGHFREGLVRTPSNFGLTGEPPTHPELLDWLAREFVRRGGSIKAMHRLILTSAAYRRSSAGGTDEADPENRLLARQNRRRLDAEEIRDALLAIAGTLDETPGGTVKGAQAGGGYYRAGPKLYDEPRRTVYLPVARHKTYELLPIFDYADTAVHLDRRPVTVVPQQALFMLNNPLVREQSAVVAGSLSGTDDEKVRELWLRLFGRPATAADASLVLRALARFRSLGGDAWARLVHALFASNDFMFLD